MVYSHVLHALTITRLANTCCWQTSSSQFPLSSLVRACVITSRHAMIFNKTLICIYIRGGLLCGSIDGYVFTTTTFTLIFISPLCFQNVYIHVYGNPVYIHIYIIILINCSNILLPMINMLFPYKMAFIHVYTMA